MEQNLVCISPLITDDLRGQQQLAGRYFCVNQPDQQYKTFWPHRNAFSEPTPGTREKI